MIPLKRANTSVRLMARTSPLGTGLLATLLATGLIMASATNLRAEQSVQGLAELNAEKPSSLEASADKAFPLLKGFLSLSPQERDRITIIYILKVKHGDIKQVSITLKDNGQSQKLSILSDGRISPLPTLNQIKNGARIKVTGPAGISSALRLRVLAAQPYMQVIDASTLSAGIAQTNKVAKKLAGVLAGAVPKITSAYFSGANQGVVINSDGTQQPLPLSPGNSMIAKGTPYFSPQNHPKAVKIRLNAVPSRITYDQDIK